MIRHCYPFRFSPGGEEHVCHVSRDEDHGGESHEPADPLTPRREHVVIHCERNHLDGAEQKHSLKKRRRLSRLWERRFSLSKLLYFSTSSSLENRQEFTEIRDFLRDFSSQKILVLNVTDCLRLKSLRICVRENGRDIVQFIYSFYSETTQILQLIKSFIIK